MAQHYPDQAYRQGGHVCFLHIATALAVESGHHAVIAQTLVQIICAVQLCDQPATRIKLHKVTEHLVMWESAVFCVHLIFLS